MVDYTLSNYSGAGVNYNAGLMIGSTTYRIASNQNEADQGTGHISGSSSLNAIPILLYAGESFVFQAVTAGLSVLCTEIWEFDDTSPLERATLTTWVAGENTLLEVPTGKTMSMGVFGLTKANNPNYVLDGLLYANGSGATRVLSGMWSIPPGGTSSNGNRLVATGNNILNNGVFAKYLGGAFAPGTKIVIGSDSSLPGQIAFMNYVLFPL